MAFTKKIVNIDQIDDFIPIDFFEETINIEIIQNNPNILEDTPSEE